MSIIDLAIIYLYLSIYIYLYLYLIYINFKIWMEHEQALEYHEKTKLNTGEDTIPKTQRIFSIRLQKKKTQILRKQFTSRLKRLIEHQRDRQRKWPLCIYWSKTLKLQSKENCKREGSNHLWRQAQHNSN